MMFCFSYHVFTFYQLFFNLSLVENIIILDLGEFSSDDNILKCHSHRGIVSYENSE